MSAAEGTGAGGPREDLAPGLELAFAPAVPECCLPTRLVSGEVPAFLRGTCYWNGPGRFARGDLRFRHWLDGDGRVSALRFDGAADGGTATFTSRYVASSRFTAEEAAGGPLFRAFGTAFPGDRLSHGIALESPVNVSVFPFAGALLVCGEQGIPWELDPRTLETRRPYTFGGALNAVTPFAAHAKIDPGTGELCNFGVSFASAQPSLSFYRFDAGGVQQVRKRMPIPHASSLHDFALSDRYAAFYLSPYVMDAGAIRERGLTPMEALAWQPERGTRLLVVRRDTGEPVADVPAGDRYCLHTIGAHEDGERLLFDLIELDRPVYDQYQEIPDLFTTVGEGRPVRLVVDLARGERGGIVERREIAYTAAPDFPSIDPRCAQRPYDDLWLLGISHTGRPGRKFFDQLVHARWSRPEEVELWQAPRFEYLASEPLFVPDPAAAHGHGAIVCLLFAAAQATSRCLIFDAQAIAGGPTAVLDLGVPVPPMFHAAFAPA